MGQPQMPWSPDLGALHGRVAVVAGATRGAGRGIATALGEAGATVICTGRSTGSRRSEYNRAETIEETAEMVTRLGGVGVPILVDHLDPDQVHALSRQIHDEHGHIDVLVNDIWGGELLKGGPADWNRPVWVHDLDKGLRILRLSGEQWALVEPVLAEHDPPAPKGPDRVDQRAGMDAVILRLRTGCQGNRLLKLTRGILWFRRMLRLTAT